MIHEKHLPKSTQKIFQQIRKLYPRCDVWCDNVNKNDVIRFIWHRKFDPSIKRAMLVAMFNPDVFTVQKAAKSLLWQIKEKISNH